MGCADCAKMILTTLNTLLLMLGLVPLIFGIIALASNEILSTVISYIPGTDHINEIVNLEELIKSSAIYMIVLGALLASLGFIGCCGACCKIKWLLYLYLVLMTLIVLGEIAVIVLAVAFPQTFNSGAVTVMRESLKEFDKDCMVDSTTGAVDCTQLDGISLAWHSMQFELSCCGAYNISDYTTVVAEWTRRDTNALAPVTCCSGLKSDNSSYPPTKGDDIGCLSPGDNLKYYNTMGCIDAVLHWIVSSPVVIGIMSAIGVLELILIVMTIIQLRNINDKNKHSWNR